MCKIIQVHTRQYKTMHDNARPFEPLQDYTRTLDQTMPHKIILDHKRQFKIMQNHAYHERPYIYMGKRLEEVDAHLRLQGPFLKLSPF